MIRQIREFFCHLICTEKINKQLQFHDKGAGEACKVIFSFLLNDSCGLGGSARSLLMAFKAVELNY